MDTPSEKIITTKFTKKSRNTRRTLLFIEIEIAIATDIEEQP